jgi:hypothetical protein
MSAYVGNRPFAPGGFGQMARTKLPDGSVSFPVFGLMSRP